MDWRRQGRDNGRTRRRTKRRRWKTLHEMEFPINFKSHRLEVVVVFDRARFHPASITCAVDTVSFLRWGEGANDGGRKNGEGEPGVGRRRGKSRPLGMRNCETHSGADTWDECKSGCVFKPLREISLASHFITRRSPTLDVYHLALYPEGTTRGRTTSLLCTRKTDRTGAYSTIRVRTLGSYLCMRDTLASIKDRLRANKRSRLRVVFMNVCSDNRESLHA